MPPFQPGWLNATDLEAILTGQHVMLTAMFSPPSLESVLMPRHLLEKYSTLLITELEIQDRDDPRRRDRVVELYMNSLWQSYFPEILEDIPAMRAEWDMLKLFFKWMLCGALVEKPGLRMGELSWALACDALFKADVDAAWGREEGMARQAPAA